MNLSCLLFALNFNRRNIKTTTKKYCMTYSLLKTYFISVKKTRPIQSLFSVLIFLSLMFFFVFFVSVLFWFFTIYLQKGG